MYKALKVGQDTHRLREGAARPCNTRHKTYGEVANQTANPRELEADLLLNAAARLQAVRDGWDSKRTPSSTRRCIYNRKLWSIFLTSATSPDNPLPAASARTSPISACSSSTRPCRCMADPKPEALGSLISINRELAAGLLGRA